MVYLVKLWYYCSEMWLERQMKNDSDDYDGEKMKINDVILRFIYDGGKKLWWCMEWEI